ncbi:MAG: AAA family ATPase [Methanosarcinaceae archaeon]|nr:AAA family ATPase [Methanosarcinaceae archaeon]
MNIQIKNLGVLKQTEFSLGDMTIICGENNTGKTYTTYALFGFLSFWQETFYVPVKDKYINQLLADGVVHIGLLEYIQDAEHILSEACKTYAKQLPKVFAASADLFKTADFQVALNSEDIRLRDQYEGRIGSAKAELFSITKDEGSKELVVTLLVEKDEISIPKKFIVQIIGSALKDVIFSNHIPNPFIASAERTGAAIFRKELNFNRNRILKKIAQEDKNINPRDFLLKEYQDYALPVEKNVDFTRRLETIAKQSSFIAEKHSDVLSDFADIIGGKYTVTPEDELYYEPKGKRIKLTMSESSSAVRSLLDIGFYLRHVAQPGDLLMVDEPELNLHPENQRRMARLFARLVNLGIKVFTTTHSDYIIKELNTLIMLNHDKPYLKRIAENEGYNPEELISSDQIKVYIAEKELVKLDGGSRRSRVHTLTLADIDPELGIEARSFDKTINKMNRIQEEIVWGEDE